MTTNARVGRGDAISARGALPAMSWAGFLALASSRPDLPGSLPFDLPFADKVAHAVAYGVLALLLLAAGVSAPWSVVACAVWGVNDEVHQRYVPGRDASLGDLLADAAGATVAVWAWRRSVPSMRRWRPGRRGPPVRRRRLHNPDAPGDDGEMTRTRP